VKLLVGTRRGLFIATADSSRLTWRIDGPHMEGYEVYHAVADVRDGRTAYAAVNHPVWGSHIYRSSDGGTHWDQLPERPAFPADSHHELRAIWHIAPGDADRPGRLYAGTEPGALFVSDDGGGSWEWVRSLESHPTRALWQPAKGGLALHSIQLDPRDPARIYVALSAGGVYRSNDDGRSWAAINSGVRADFLPEPLPVAGQCVHSVRLHPAEPDRLYQQNHCGLYRSDDRGENWTEISDGLPSDISEEDTAASQAVDRFDQMEAGLGEIDPDASEPGLPDEEALPGTGVSMAVMEQWLEQIEGDPAYLLLNQFRIEEQQALYRNRRRLLETRPW